MLAKKSSPEPQGNRIFSLNVVMSDVAYFLNRWQSLPSDLTFPPPKKNTRRAVRRSSNLNLQFFLIKIYAQAIEQQHLIEVDWQRLSIFQTRTHGMLYVTDKNGKRKRVKVRINAKHVQKITSMFWTNVETFYKKFNSIVCFFIIKQIIKNMRFGEPSGVHVSLSYILAS